MKFNIDTAYLVAQVAHAAIGQTRADGVTPYIVHPARVATLVKDFAEYPECAARNILLEDRVIAALLHDTLEDTKLTELNLFNFGATEHQVAIVKALTKPDDAPARAEYYQGIADFGVDALVVKCADRCANLEDAEREVLAGRGVERWKKYAAKTRKMMLALYDDYPNLQAELVGRLQLLEKAEPPAV